MISDTDARKLILDFAKDNGNTPALKFICEDPDSMVIKEQTGLINYTYRVTSKDRKHSVILKHGKEYMKGISTDRITLDRQVLEYNCLGLMELILPGSAPKPYCLDRTHNIIAMEDMGDWEHFMEAHQTGDVDFDVATSLGHLLSQMHQLTSKSRLSSERWQQLSIFRQDEMKTIMGNLLWEIPYIETHKMNKIPAKALTTYRMYVEELKYLGHVKEMVDLYWEEQCLIHADCHWMSVFVKEGKAALFDFEFGFLSHPAQNVGFVVVDYYFCYVLAQSKMENKTGNNIFGTQSIFKQAVGTLLEAYLADHSDMSADEGKDFLTHTALFAGGILFAKSIFRPHEALDYYTEPLNLRLFHTGFTLMKGHEDLQTVKGLVTTLFEN